MCKQRKEKNTTNYKNIKNVKLEFICCKKTKTFQREGEGGCNKKSAG